MFVLRGRCAAKRKKKKKTEKRRPQIVKFTLFRKRGNRFVICVIRRSPPPPLFHCPIFLTLHPSPPLSHAGNELGSTDVAGVVAVARLFRDRPRGEHQLFAYHPRVIV